MARAMPMRCRWPPENSWGNRETARCEIPTRLRSSSTFSRLDSGAPIPWMTNGSSTMLPTVCRELRDSNGSWKIICMSRRRLRKAPWSRVAKSFPSNSTLPPVGVYNRRMERPTVVFPQPDSPTKPRVSPVRAFSETPSTACTLPTLRRNTPPPDGKVHFQVIDFQQVLRHSPRLNTDSN